MVVVLDFLLFVLVDVLYGTILWGITMKCRHFPTFFCAGTKKKKMSMSPTGPVSRILPTLSAVSDMSPTFPTKLSN